MSKSTKPRLEDVAKLAGVSLGSASNALSSPQSVKPATLRKVEEAVRKLGYVRNAAARALASNRSYSIGAVFPSITNPIFADTMQAIQIEASKLGYQLFIASTEYSVESELASVKNLLERGVEGMLFVGTDHEPEIFDTLKSGNRPYILMWSLDECDTNYGVGFYNQQAGQMITEHLLGLGHEKFAVISGPIFKNDRMRLRLKGIRDTLAKQGIDLPDDQVIEHPLTLEGGRAGLINALELKTRPTALITLSDILAMGVNAEAKEQNVHIPKEISIASIDNNTYSSVAIPAITTLETPANDIGRKSAQHIIALIEGKKPPRLEEVSLQLLIRDSSGPAPKD
ncbi:LacI family DNA-binding transcriptional regulator [Terasakiella pusilla]|uniref:LacI family DNA-binding transcriptional regulator n=1 Tax=Terasakiella pusilla TaxID=64973 RepID=UPI003AA90396